MKTTEEKTEIRVWDPLVRIFHWTLVISFVVDYATGDELETIHVWFGYLIAGLLAFRILWGFVGPKHARFSDFVRPPREVLAYLKSLFSGSPRRYLGHNPAGGAMIVALLASLLLTVASGILMIQFPATEELIEEVHEFFANLTLILVLAHIAGVFISGRLHHENLVRAMITGRKPVKPEQ